MRKPNQSLTKKEETELHYEVYRIGYYLMSELGMDEPAAMGLAVDMVDLRLRNEMLEAMKAAINVSQDV